MASFKESQLIEKLNQKNYSNWKFKVQMVLIKEDLIELITQDPPTPITDDWRKKDNKARALINLVIDDSQIVHVRNLSTARDTWNTLKNIHERANLSSKLYLLRKLYNTKLEEKGNMNDHVTRVLQAVEKLKAIGEEVTDSHLSAILLCSLPQSYDTLITALEARPEPELTSEFIRSKLIDEFSRREEMGTQHSENTARAFQINKKRNYNNNFRRDNKFCTYCKLKNHNREDCWQLKKQHYNNQKPKYQGYKPHKQNNSSLCYNPNNEYREKKESNEKSVEQTTSKLKDLAFLVSKSHNETWIIDSGSSAHITNDRSVFTKFTNSNKSQVIIANGKSLTSHGSGDAEIETKTSEGDINKITLKDVLYVPEIETNLLSVNKATQNGCTVIFNKNNCKIIHDGKIYIEGTIKNNLYEIFLKSKKEHNYARLTRTCNNKHCIEIWHKRLGHRHYDSIKEITAKELATGLTLDKCGHDAFCESCVKAKLTNQPYPHTAQNRARNVLELIHSDVCGPMQTQSIGGRRYFLTLIDDYSRFTIIYLISKKSEVNEKIKEYVAKVHNKFGKKPQNLRTDNGGEYVNRELENYLKENGINHQLTVPHCPSQNGVAERKNRSLVEMTRSMITEAGLPHKFWGEAISTANYLQNRLPTKANLVTPYQLWNKSKPDLSHLKVFGCKAYTYIDKHKRGKLDNKAEEGIFVGYDYRSKGYRVYTNDKNIIISRTVKCVEDIYPYKNTRSEEKQYLEENPTQNTQKETVENSVEIMVDSLLENLETPADNVTPDQPRRSDRSNRGVPPDRYACIANKKTIHEPTTWDEVKNMENPGEKRNWMKATEEEMNSLKDNKTWSLEDLPTGKKVIGSRWTFKAKCNKNGDIEKYKARLVAKGYSQKYGEDFYETFAPVVSYTAIRTFLAMAAHKRLIVNHLDVKTAFLHGELEESVYMKQPDGYVVPGKEEKVCQLNKAIYGLKQAARAWHIKIAKTLEKLGFVQGTTEQCLFKRSSEKATTYLIVYVDDILIAGNEKEIEEVIERLQTEFEIKNLGDINYYLGINIRKTENGNYALSQKLKIDEIVNKYNLEESKPCSTPIEPGYEKTEEEENLLPNNHNYRQAIGSLLYIATICRPDICAGINILSRRNEKPRRRDWEQVKRVIRYLKTTKNLELLINTDSEPVLTAYADADWGGDQVDRKSTSGNIFLLGKTPIHWITKKQSSVALSSAEAEFISVANAAQEITWIVKLLEELDLPQKLPITLLEDNQSCIKMVESPKHTNRTKHIDIKECYIRDLSQKCIIQLKYCPTKLMTADSLTKPLPKPEFQRHRLEMQLHPYNDS